MKSKAIFLICSIALFDIAVFITALVFPQFWIRALIAHAILYLIVNILQDRYLKQYQGIPNYFFLFLPGFGGIIILILHFSMYYFLRDSAILEDYEKYLNHELYRGNKATIEYEKEVRMLSFVDSMNLLDADHKKALIMNLGANELDNKVKLLQKGLLDQDIEVQHYSAITLNVIENEYAFHINNLREKYNQTKDSDLLFNLAKSYKDYINSGLLADKVLEVFNSEYIDILNKIFETEIETFEFTNELVKAYIRNGNFEHAEEANRFLSQRYDDGIETFLNKMRIAYERKQFEQLRQLINCPEINIEEIPEVYQDIIAYWIRNEEQG